MRHVGCSLKRRVAATGVVTLLTVSAFAVTALAAPGKKKPKLPNVVYIRFQLSESFDRVSTSTGTDQASAVIDEVQAVTPADLKHDTIIPALRLRWSGVTASIPGSNGTCEYRGKLASGAEPQITLRHAHHHIYGLIPWPDQVGGNWLLGPSPTGCPSFVSFSPLQGPIVFSNPSVSFSAMDRFYNAIFPISVPSGQRKIKVSMSSDENFAGETNQTRANGLITISYGRCPDGLKKCKPTNGKP